MSPPLAARTLARWRAFALGAGLVALACVHSPILGYKKLADVDEGYALAIAERLLEGFKLYDGAVSQRGPLMYYGYALIAAVTGWDNPLGLRCWALGFAIGNVLLVYWAGARLFSRSAGVVAALLFVYALGFGMPLRDSVALHGETMQLPFLLTSVVLGAIAVRTPTGRSRTVRLVLSGITMGLGICIKQSLFLHPLPLVVWLVLSGHKNRVPPGVTLRQVGVFAGAVAAAPAIFVAHAAATGTLGELYYYCFRYNVDVHLQPGGKSLRWLTPLFDRLNERTLFFLALVLLVARAVPFVVRRARAASRLRSAWTLGRGFGAEGYVALHFVCALVTASSMSRFFPHYFIQALPFLTLLIAAGVRRWLESPRRGAQARLAVSVFAGFLVVYGGLAVYFEEKFDGRVAHDALVERLARYIEAATTPDERIFVWGFSPWLYSYSHRRPAGRFVFETYVTGFVPWFWDDLDVEKKRVVPGSMEALLSDLDRERPELVIDAGAVIFGRPMRAYEQPAAWLHEHYCFSFRFAAYDVYRRKAADGSCAGTAFPRSPGPVDFYGAGLAVLMPPLVDEATSRWLPTRELDKPVWFAGQPRPAQIDAIRDRRREKDEAEALGKLGIKSVSDILPPPPCE